MKPSNESLLAERRYGELWLRSMNLTKHVLGHMVRRGKLPSHSITDDMLQECYIAAGKAVYSWEPSKGAFSTWVFRHVAQAARDFTRHENSGILGIGGFEPFQEDRFEDERADVQTKIEKRQAVEHLVSLLDRLPGADAALLRARYGIGCEAESVKDLARRYGVAPSTLKMRMREIMMRVAVMLTPTQEHASHEPGQTCI